MHGRLTIISFLLYRHEIGQSPGRERERIRRLRECHVGAHEHIGIFVAEHKWIRLYVKQVIAHRHVVEPGRSSGWNGESQRQLDHAGRRVGHHASCGRCR